MGKKSAPTRISHSFPHEIYHAKNHANSNDGTSDQYDQLHNSKTKYCKHRSFQKNCVSYRCNVKLEGQVMHPIVFVSNSILLELESTVM